MRWREITDTPTDREAIRRRRRVVEAAMAPGHVERLDVIREHCLGMRVLDLGCVGHSVDTREIRPGWLHDKVRGWASECVGVDYEPKGVAALREAGLTVELHDITTGAGPLANLPPFDVVVAGEIVEHLDTPRAIFDLARDVLRRGGHLIVTTPNPYGQTRVRAGQLGLGWENVDHILYLPPSGAVELAERAGGLTLTSLGTSEPEPLPARRMLNAAKQWVSGRGYRHSTSAVTPVEWLLAKSRPSLMRGETVTYVFQRD